MTSVYTRSTKTPSQLSHQVMHPRIPTQPQACPHPCQLPLPSALDQAPFIPENVPPIMHRGRDNVAITVAKGARPNLDPSQWRAIFLIPREWKFLPAGLASVGFRKLCTTPAILSRPAEAVVDRFPPARSHGLLHQCHEVVVVRCPQHSVERRKAAAHGPVVQQFTLDCVVQAVPGRAERKISFCTV